MNQKTLNDIANQEFANMKKIVDQTPKSLEKLFDMMKEPVEILESEVDYSNVTDSKEFLIDLVLPQEEIDQQLKNGTITIAQAQHFTKILKETLKQQEKQIYGFLAQKMANTAFRNEEILTMLAHGYNSQYKAQLDNLTINRIVKQLLTEKMLPSYIDDNGKIIPYELSRVIIEYNHIKTERYLSFIYNGKYYSRVEDELYHVIDPYIEEKIKFTKPLRLEVFDHIQNQTRVENLLETEINYINFENGLLNIETRELEPHTPEIFSLGTFKGSYDPMKSDITGTVWEQFLKSSLDESLIPLIQEMVGLCLFPLTRKTRKCFILLGEGSNGKSIILNTLNKIIPSYLKTSLSMSNYNDKFRAAMLKGKTVNINTDDETDKLESVGAFKKAISHEHITVEHKNKDPHEILVNLTHISSFNRLPELKETSDAFFNRLVIIPFSKTFGTEEEFLEKKVDGIANPNLENMISNELDTIIAWGIEGLYRIIDNKYKLSENELTKISKREYLETADTVIQWIRECIVRHEELPNPKCLKTSHMYKAYVSWANNEGYSPVKRSSFNETIKKELGRQGKPYNNNQVYKVSFKGYNRND